MTARPITLPKITFQSFDPSHDEPGSLFGPDASAREIKNGAAAGAGRREVDAMQAVAIPPRIFNAAPSGAAGDPLDILRLVGDQSVIKLTASQAGGLVRRCRYEKQDRDLKPAGRSHVAVLADIMRRKQWRSMDQITFARLADKLILINGHHRLTAQERSGEEITWMVVIHACKTNEDVAKLYYTFDTNGRSRGISTILGALDAAELLGVNKTTASSLYRAAPLLVVNFDFNRAAQDAVTNRVVDRRLEVMKSFATEAQQFEDAIKKAPPMVRRKLYNQGAMAVALTTFRFRPFDAEKFWRGISENDGLRKGDPRHTYLTAILTTSAAGTGNAAYTARQAAVAWNAWAERRSLSIIKIVEANAFRIVGARLGR